MCLSISVHHPQVVLSSGEYLGFEWVVVHNTIGFRCGYVRVPFGHPWHGKHYDEIDADVHGGLNFNEADVHCNKGGEDNAWWVGFDCAHFGDAPDPSLPKEPTVFDFLSGRGGIVRSQTYVEAECKRLIKQALIA